MFGEPLSTSVGETIAARPARRSKRLRWGVGGAAGVLGIAMAASAALGSHGLDLTTPGSSGVINGATFQQADFTDSSLGTGVINSFLRIQQDGTEQGFNTDNGTPFDTKGGPFTKSILLSDIPTVDLGGSSFREVWLDINETASTNLISLDEYEIYVSSDGNLAEAAYSDVGPTLDGQAPVYDMDAGADRYILLDYNNASGSGNNGDMVTYIPESVFDAYPDCDYGSTSCTDYFYLYSEFGLNEDANNSVADAGFEEYFVIQRPVLAVTKTAELDFTRTFDWTIEKSVDPGEHTGFVGDSFSSDYSVTVTKDAGTDSAKTLSGTVVVENIGGVDADIESLTDQLAGHGAVALDCDAAVPGILDAGDTITCTYDVVVADDFTVSTNTAMATIAPLLGSSASFSDTVDVVVNQPTLVNDAIDVFDDFGDDGVDRTLGEGVTDTTTFPTYQQSFDCTEQNSSFEGVTTTYPNTATTSLGDSSQANVEVTCYELAVSKTGAATRTVDYDWTTSKSASPELIQLFDGESSTVEWTIEIVKSDPETTSQTLAGTITIVNPNPEDAADVTVTDTYPGATITVDCSDEPGDQSAVTVPAAGEVTCDYVGHAFVGDLADGTNTATVDRNGQQLIATAPIVVAETVTDDCVVVSDVSELGGGFGPVETCEGLTIEGDDDPSFSQDVRCADDEGEWSNTVSIDGDADHPAGNSATATTSVECYQLTVEKDGTASRLVDYEWSIEKTADPEQLELFYGESGTIDWTIEVVKSAPITESQALGGTITVGNPHPSADATVDVADTYPNATVTVDCDADTDGAQNSGVVVPAGGQLDCTYVGHAFTGDLPDADNVATVTHVSNPAPATFPIVVTETVQDDCVVVTDDLAPDGLFGDELCESRTAAGQDAFTYPTEPECGRDDFTVTNTAVIDGDEDDPEGNSDDASTDVTCVELSITKDVVPHFTRTYDYTIDKTAQLPADGVINLNFGESYIITWDVVLTEAGFSDSSFNIDTTVVISNPSDRVAMGVSVADSIPGITLDCAWPGDLTNVVPANGSVTCTSVADPVGGEVTSNSATVTAYGVVHDTAEATWAFDTPDTEVHETVNVQDFFGPLDGDLTGRLQPQPTTYTWGSGVGDPRTASWTLMTLVSTDAGDDPDLLLGCGRTVVDNDVVLLGDGGVVLDESTAQAPVDVLCGTACTLTQGYWRTHSAAGPKGNHEAYVADGNVWKHRDETWDSLIDWDGDLVLEFEDEEFFGTGMTWWQVQWEAPQGHFYFNLAHQWIATHLNVWQEANEAFGGDFDAAFATLPPEVKEAYDDALAFFAGEPDPYDRLKGQAKRHITTWHGTLASFNEGDFPGWPHCDENSEAEVVTFGQLLGLL